MKLFIAVFALAAVAFAEPEADPFLFYSKLGYNYSPLATTSYAHGIYNPLGYRSAYTYGAHTYSSALPAVYNAAYPSVYGAGVYAGLAKPVSYYANSGGAVHITKRDADAEADPSAFYGQFGYSYAPFAASTYAHGLYNPLRYRSAYTYGAHAYSTFPSVYNAAYPSVYGAGVYAGLAKPVSYYANSGGAVHITKRDADAEADPSAFYSQFGYNYAPFAASTYARGVYSPYAATTYAAYSPLATRYSTAYTTPYAYNNIFGYRAGFPYFK